MEQRLRPDQEAWEPLQHQAGELIRELLLTMRAVIDWSLERLDTPRHDPEVEDIPID